MGLCLFTRTGLMGRSSLFRTLEGKEMSSQWHNCCIKPSTNRIFGLFCLCVQTDGSRLLWIVKWNTAKRRKIKAVLDQPFFPRLLACVRACVLLSGREILRCQGKCVVTHTQKKAVSYPPTSLFSKYIVYSSYLCHVCVFKGKKLALDDAKGIADQTSLCC